MESLDISIIHEVMRTCPVGLVVIDDTQTIVGINNHGAELFECLPDEMIGSQLSDYVLNNPTHDADVKAFVDGDNDPDRAHKHVTAYGKGKYGRLVQLSIKVHQLSNGLAYAIFHDPAEFSTGDSLTNTLSRDQFFIKLNKMDTEFSLMFIDLNKFKKVNDDLGHITGDFVLKTAAKRIQNILRSTDLLCRYGGDEFVVVIPGVSSGATTVKEKIQMLIKEPIKTRTDTINISCSIGVATSDESNDIDELIHIADQRMYEEKA